MAENNVEFVTIELNRKRVITDNLKEDKNGKKYATVFAPDGGTFLYLVDKLKVSDRNPDVVFFSLPVGSEMQISYREGNEFVTRSMSIEDLKEAYAAEKAAFAKNNDYVSMTVPTEWGNHFTSKSGDELVSVSIPVMFEDNKQYMEFVVKADYFRVSDKNEGMSYFSFPTKKKIDGVTSDEDYIINLKGSQKQIDGSYVDISKTVTSSELGELVKNAVSSSNFKEMFVSTVISEKLVRDFISNAGKSLCEVSVPVAEENADVTTWYKVVVPSERVKKLEDGKMALNLFRKGSNGDAYTFKAVRSIKNEAGEYSDVSITLTSEEVVNAFNTSKERYASSSNTHSIADEMNGTTPSLDNTQANVRRTHGR